MKLLIWLFGSIFSNSGAATEVAKTLTGNFEGGSGAEYFRYDPSNISAGVRYFSKSVGGVRFYDINVEGDCNVLRIYASFGSKNKIVLDGSCEGQGSQVHQYVYRWDKQYKDWCLAEEVSGERPDRISGSDERLKVQQVSGCVRLGSGQK